MAKLHLEIVTPERKVLETDADYITLPGELGELGVLPSHLPLLTSIGSGVLSFSKGGVKTRYAWHYGFAEVHRDQITVLAKLVEQGKAIDMDRAREAKRRAEEELRVLDRNEEQRQAKLEAKLLRSLSRIEAGRILQ